MKAENAIGFGKYSQTNTAGSRVETEPEQVTGLDFDPDISSLTTLQISWKLQTTHEETGGSPVLNYKIQHDSGTGTWVDVATVAAGVDNYLIETLTPGTDYQIVVLAENIHGWSSPSEALSERAAD